MPRAWRSSERWLVVDVEAVEIGVEREEQLFDEVPGRVPLGVTRVANLLADVATGLEPRGAQTVEAPVLVLVVDELARHHMRLSGGCDVVGAVPRPQRHSGELPQSSVPSMKRVQASRYRSSHPGP